jgi:hypothetical protein
VWGVCEVNGNNPLTGTQYNWHSNRRTLHTELQYLSNTTNQAITMGSYIESNSGYFNDAVLVGSVVAVPPYAVLQVVSDVTYKDEHCKFYVSLP